MGTPTIRPRPVNSSQNAISVGSRIGAIPRGAAYPLTPYFLWECFTSRTVSRFPAPAGWLYVIKHRSHFTVFHHMPASPKYVFSFVASVVSNGFVQLVGLVPAAEGLRPAPPLNP